MTEIRDPRSEIRDPCDSHRSDLDQKRRQNVLRTLMTHSFTAHFDVCDPQMNSHMEK